VTRINLVASARARKDGRPERKCYACHLPIAVGTAYRWAQPSRYSARIDWHDACPAPAPSALESNEKRSMAMAAFEAAYDDAEALRDSGADAIKDEAEALLSCLSDALGEVEEMYRESAANIEDGFGHPTSSSEEQEEMADTYSSMIGDLDSDLDAWDEDDTERTEDAADYVERIADEVAGLIADAESQMP